MLLLYYLSVIYITVYVRDVVSSDRFTYLRHKKLD